MQSLHNKQATSNATPAKLNNTDNQKLQGQSSRKTDNDLSVDSKLRAELQERERAM